MPDSNATRTAPPPLPDIVTADPDVTRTHPGGSAALGHLVLPGYEVLEVIGRGGMGVVYKARQTAVNRIVALKMTLAGTDAGPTATARFQIEAEAVAALQHPGIVQLFEFGQANHVQFLALEYVPGGTLAERMAKRPFTPREAAELVATLADGVHAAHQKGVIHRDLKPGNVLMTEASSPKITDFGLARIGRSDLTHAGAIMGTPSYMSPEQATGDVKAIGTPADVWALGAILYTLLTGRPPFRREDVTATLHAVIHAPPTSPRWHDRKVPRDLETICLKCLSKDPADRYRTADALAADLRAYLGGYPVAARPVGFVRRMWKLARRNPIRTVITLSVLAVGIALGVLVPRYTPAVSTPTAKPGVWVTEEKEAEVVFETARLNATVYTYTGGAVEFWVELHRPDHQVQRLQAHNWDADPVEAIRTSPGQVISGRWVWVRGEPNKAGDEDWTVGYHRKKTTADTAGGSVANVSGVGRGEKSELHSGETKSSSVGTLHFGPPSSAKWFNGTSKLVNPIAEDRPVCLKTVEGGFGHDAQKPQYTIRVMCQVLTAELAERRKAESRGK